MADSMLPGGGCMDLETPESVIINMALFSTSAMKLSAQKAKEWAGSSHQSHGFNLSHIAQQVKDSWLEKKRYTVQIDSDNENF